MEITVLDGYTASHGNFSWDWLNQYGNVTIYDRTPENLVFERSKNSDALFINKVIINKDMISRLTKLKYIGLMSTGCNVVDISAASARNIIVTNVPVYSTNAVAQMVFSLILEHTNMVSKHSNSVKSGDWSKCKDFCYWLGNLTELDGKTIGIIGFGKIGQKVAKIAEAFSMNILVSTPHPKKEFKTDNIQFVTLDRLLENSDFVTLHCPLTADTRNLVNSDFLFKMKRTAILINTARGASVDENALAYALKNKIIAGAGIDVMTNEPPAADNPLFECDNCYITPHIAWAAYETRERLLYTVRRNFEEYIIKGTSINNVAI